jgi:uracil-DNA glycosylase
MAPLTHYVERLRIERGSDAWVPYFDPTEAGVNARILILLESPGPRASGPRGSQFVSVDNNDQTAANMWNLLREAGVQRGRDVVAWNVVPWYVGRQPSPDEVKAARPWITELISLLPELRVVLLLGKTAKKSWGGLDADVPVILAPHPSPQNLNTRPEARAHLLEALIQTHQLSASSA